MIVGETVDGTAFPFANSAESAEKPLRATLLAEPFPGTVAQGVSLPKMREMNEISFGQNRRAAQIKVLGARGRREWVASILAAVQIASSAINQPFQLKSFATA